MDINETTCTEGKDPLKKEAMLMQRQQASHFSVWFDEACSHRSVRPSHQISRFSQDTEAGIQEEHGNSLAEENLILVCY